MRIAVVLVLGLGLVGSAAPVVATPVQSSPVGAYRPPLTGELQVVRPFVAPTTRYGPGHRGVDLATTPGQQVLAPADGQVTFAGSVAGRGVVVLGHDDGVRTEYEPVQPDVRAGSRVVAGAVIATVTGQHGSCDPGRCLHWGARRGNTYFDPLTLLQPLGPVVLLPLSGPRMGLRVGLAQPLHGDMRVELGGRQAGMTEELLDAAQVRPALEEVRRGGVPQAVWADVRCTRHGRDPAVDDLADGALVEASTSGPEQQGRPAGRSGQLPPAVAEPLLERTLSGLAVRDGALLVALAQDADHAPRTVDVIEIEADELGDPNAGGVEQFHDQTIPVPDRVVGVGGRLHG